MKRPFWCILVLFSVWVMFEFYGLFAHQHTLSQRPTPKFNSTKDSRIQFLIPEKNICVNISQGVFNLLIIITSAIDNFEARGAIRNSWGSDVSVEQNSTKLVFLLGTRPNEALQKRVVQESESYKDIIQGQFFDSYRNLTLKSVAMVKWVKDFCPNVRFILKTDDDTFFNMENLLLAIDNVTKSYESTPALYGYPVLKTAPQRTTAYFPKWFISLKEYTKTYYPDYLSGTGYLMTRDAIGPLYRGYLHEPEIFLEDVYLTGICAEYSKVPRYRLAGFNDRRLEYSGCSFKDIVFRHMIKPPKIISIWKEFHNQTIKC